ncbi:hypothetical protein C8R45DRAFT_789772, partial [Mycena sanguinolenta]
ISIRSQVWAMNLYFNPTLLWVTLSFPEHENPVTQVLAGQQIDLDRFTTTAGPNRNVRSVNIASDLFAAAEFFHLTITVILEDMFGLTV